MPPLRAHKTRRTRQTRAAGLTAGLAGLLLFCNASLLWAESVIKSHGYSYHGDLTYGPGFEHYGFVNPDAPKGGEISFSRLGTFDSMNPYSVKGRAGVLSRQPYESLLDRGASDVYGEEYGLLAERLEYDAGKTWVIFHMRPEARFSDGTPVTAHDVLFSHNLLLEQGLPSYAAAVKKRIRRAEVIDDHTIRFHFTEGISRRSLIDQVGGVPVWSRAWYEKTGARLDESRLETSPGSGPYMIETVDVNRRIVLKRNPDYWGKELPVNVGRHNFDRIRIEYFGDDTAAFEAFKAGEYTFRQETDSRKWATQYDFPKLRKGDIVKVDLPSGAPPTPTGIVFNLGREVLRDKRVREALALGFNFEWTNESLQYGLFKQRASFTQGSPLMANGAPQGAELEFLLSLGDVVPADMINTAARMPHTSIPDRLADRRNLRKAMRLMDEAGWPVGDDGKRRNVNGDLLTLTFLFNSAQEGTLSAVIESYLKNLTRMGIDARLEKVDPSQYTLRTRERDYDLVYDSYAAFLGAGTGLMQRYGTPETEINVFNPANLASPLVDAIIDAALNAETRAEENTRLMALDRALRYEFFIVPVWYNDSHWVAYYDQYAYPDPLPPYALGFLDFWWYDADRGEALKANGALR